MADGIWKVKAYIEYELEASSEDEAIQRLSECIVRDLEDSDIREIAEVAAEEIREGTFEGEE